LPGDGYDPANYMDICGVSRNSWHKLDLYWRDSLSTYNVHVDGVDYGYFKPRDASIRVDEFYLGDNGRGVQGIRVF
jgi:hypothetical protein